MKLVTYAAAAGPRVGALRDNHVLDLQSAAAASAAAFPATMLELLEQGPGAMDRGRRLVEQASMNEPWALPLEQVRLLAPVPRPRSLRDAYAFRQHVEAARRSRGLTMPEEYDRIPVFYYSNHNAVYGPGPVPVRRAHLERLDFELECAVVIGKAGRDIPAERADEYIAGFMVMNDLSARALQAQEMKLNLGPAKGKDFATVLGPWLVTPDELAHKRVSSPEGDRYDLLMTATVNGEPVSRDSLRNMHWTFAQIIERASYGTDLVPGDVIGSGTCGTGCFLELNGSDITRDRWLKPGDRVQLAIEELGVLDTKIALYEPAAAPHAR